MGDVVVTVTVEDVVVLVVDVVVIVFVFDDIVVDVVDVLQDVNSIAATSNKLKPNQITLFFICYLTFIHLKNILTIVMPLLVELRLALYQRAISQV